MRYLLDTNAIIALLSGNAALLNLLQNPQWVGISVIAEMEFLSFSGINAHDEHLFEQFKKQITIIGINTQNTQLIQTTRFLRTQYRLKLPDALIAATAIEQNAILITNDIGFVKITPLQVVHF